ncbi:hypothetical protein C8R41DRAFT_869222, partial [Lentinula lateritia]
QINGIKTADASHCRQLKVHTGGSAPVDFTENSAARPLGEAVNIVGRDFLPRGTSIVTRRPPTTTDAGQHVIAALQVLQLIHRPSTAHQNGGPPELGEDGDAAANADENMTLDSSKSIALALEAECNFFEKPSVLQRKSTILMHPIRATLPDIKARISSQLQKYNAELMQLGGFMAEHNSGDVVLSVITDVHTCSHSSTGVIYR